MVYGDLAQKARQKFSGEDSLMKWPNEVMVLLGLGGARSFSCSSRTVLLLLLPPPPLLLLLIARSPTAYNVKAGRNYPPKCSTTP